MIDIKCVCLLSVCPEHHHATPNPLTLVVVISIIIRLDVPETLRGHTDSLSLGLSDGNLHH